MIHQKVSVSPPVEKVNFALRCDEREPAAPSSRYFDLQQQVDYLERDLDEARKKVSLKRNELNLLKNTKRSLKPSEDEDSAPKRRRIEEFDVNQFFNF